jgi:hypothetical protein
VRLAAVAKYFTAAIIVAATARLELTAEEHGERRTIVKVGRAELGLERGGCQYAVVKEHSEHRYATEGEHNGHQHEVAIDKLHAEVITQYTMVAMALECRLAFPQFSLHILAFQLTQFCRQSYPDKLSSRQFSP